MVTNGHMSVRIGVNSGVTCLFSEISGKCAEKFNGIIILLDVHLVILSDLRGSHLI